MDPSIQSFTPRKELVNVCGAKGVANAVSEKLYDLIGSGDLDPDPNAPFECTC